MSSEPIGSTGSRHPTETYWYTVGSRFHADPNSDQEYFLFQPGLRIRSSFNQIRIMQQQKLKNWIRIRHQILPLKGIVAPDFFGLFFGKYEKVRTGKGT